MHDDRLVVEADGSRDTIEVERLDYHEITRRKLADFLAAVTDGTEPAVPGEYGLEVTAPTEAAYEATGTGRTVDVRSRLAVPRTTTPPSH